MNSLAGIGYWTAFWSSKDGDAEALVGRVLELGGSWVAARNDVIERLGDQLVLCAQAHGVTVVGWEYDATPENPADDIAKIDRMAARGVEHVVLDLEAEWDKRGGLSKADAVRFGEALRVKHPHKWFGHAPWPWIAGHPTYPAKELAPYVDAVLPQAYHTEIGVSLTTCLERMEREWAALETTWPAELRKPRWPIGVTYSTPHGTISPSDVVAFLDAYADVPASLYSIDHVLSPAVATALRERALARASTQPPAPGGLTPNT